MNNKEQPFQAFFCVIFTTSTAKKLKWLQLQTSSVSVLLVSQPSVLQRPKKHTMNKTEFIFFFKKKKKKKIPQEILFAAHLFHPSALNPARTHKSHLPTETHNITNIINDHKADSFSNCNTRRCSVLLPVAVCVWRLTWLVVRGFWRGSCRPSLPGQTVP